MTTCGWGVRWPPGSVPEGQPGPGVIGFLLASAFQGLVLACGFGWGLAWLWGRAGVSLGTEVSSGARPSTLWMRPGARVVGVPTRCPLLILAGRLQARVPGGQIDFSACGTSKDRLGWWSAGTGSDGPSVNHRPTRWGSAGPGQACSSETGPDAGRTNAMRVSQPGCPARVPSRAAPRRGSAAWLQEDCGYL